jgi:hypothetical protein
MRVEVNKHEYNLLLDEVHLYIKEIDGHVHVNWRSASYVTQHRCMHATYLEAHELKDHLSGCTIKPGQAVHWKGGGEIKKGDIEWVSQSPEGRGAS